MKDLEVFVQKCKGIGYNISGSVLKIDYTGKHYNVGFWIRGSNWNPNSNRYELPAICIKVKNNSFETACQEILQQAENILQGR